MRKIIKNITYSILALSILICASCEKSDNQKEWGNSLIYMPQASLLNGGITHNYPVPLNIGGSNYILDSLKNTIEIVLGVYRSGLEELKSYSVDVAIDADTTSLIITGGSIPNAVLLPSEMYTLPSSITVPDGQRGVIFYLTVDRTKLLDNYAAYYNKKLILTVGISNPSKYALNQSLSKTVVVIDSRTFMPLQTGK